MGYGRFRPRLPLLGSAACSALVALFAGCVCSLSFATAAEDEKPDVDAEDRAFRMGFTIPADPQRQCRVLDELLSFAHQRQFAFLIWFLPRDYDGLWEKVRADAPEFFGVWRDCGLLDGEGNERPAYRLWRAHFELPLR